MTSSILVPGIIHVCGDHDVGKTTFALECGAEPSRICFFDGDIKGRATVQQIGKDKFGKYIDLNELAEERNEIEFFAAVNLIIADIRENQYDAIIFDTWERYGKCFHPYVVANPAKFRKSWSPSGKIKGAEQWQEAQQYEARVLNHLGKLAKVVVIVSHLKDYYANNAKVPGKQVPAASRTLNRVPVLRIWLRHNPKSPVPMGLTLKRTNEKRYVEGVGLRTTCMLPRKITPNIRLPEEDCDSNDQSLWDTIARYYKNPIGTREPLPDEIPDEFEMSILDGTLTREMKHTLNLMLQAGVVEPVEEDDEEGEFEVIPTTWQELLTLTGKTLSDLGDFETANKMTVEEIQTKWEEWRK